MATPKTAPKYPFYTICRSNSRTEPDSVKAYLSPFVVIDVELFDTSPKIEMELPYTGEHHPPKWEATPEYRWQEELCSKKEFMRYYDQVQAQLRAQLASPANMNRQAAYMAQLDAEDALRANNYSLSATPIAK